MNIDMNMELFHSLEGENIYFKSLCENDFEEIHAYASDPEVKRFIGWDLMHTKEETRDFVREMIQREEAGTHLYASIVSKAEEKILGTAMLFHFDKETNQAEIGYVFSRACWGKGYGTESVSLISRYAFDVLKLHKLHASVASANGASAKILLKNDFEIEGRLKDHFWIEGRYYDDLLLGKISRAEAAGGPVCDCHYQKAQMCEEL